MSRVLALVLAVMSAPALAVDPSSPDAPAGDAAAPAAATRSGGDDAGQAGGEAEQTSGEAGQVGADAGKSQQAGEPGKTGGATKEGEAKPPPAPEKAPSLNFELLPPAKVPSEKAKAELDRQVALRRNMLTLHQGLGLVTLAALTATVIVGQLDFDDRFRGGGDTGRYLPYHTGLAIGTSALFATVGLLGVLAPVPYPKKFQLDTATLHKAAMAIATVGMVTQIVLGVWSRNLQGSTSERDVAVAHQIVGYATLGAFTVGTVVFVF